MTPRETAGESRVSPEQSEAFLAALEVLFTIHDVALASREEITIVPLGMGERVRDRRRYRSADPTDGDAEEFEEDLYAQVPASELAVDRIRRDTGLVPHRFCTY